jgi:hypothetical protein
MPNIKVTRAEFESYWVNRRRRKRRLVGGFSDEAQALFSRFADEPDTDRKVLMNDLIVALKTAGVWAKLDAFYVLAAADAQSSLLNWVSASYNLTTVNAPTFVADQGYTGNGTTSYLDTGFNPTTAPSPKFTQNSAHLGLWSRTNLPNGAADSQDAGSANAYIGRSVAVAGRALGRPNTSAGQQFGDGAYPGHAVWARSAAAVWESYAQGVDAGGGTTASAAPTNSTLAVLRSRDGNFGANQIASVHVGSNLSAGEVLATYSALNAYLAGVPGFF